MTFENLPEDWPTRSLSHADLARDVLDLVVSNKDRDGGGISILFCGATGRLMQPVFITDATPEQDLTAGMPVVRVATSALCPDPEEAVEPQPLRSGSVLFALVRRRGGVTDTDRAWHQRVIEECRDAGLRLLGVHLVTLDGVETLPALPSSAGALRPGNVA